MPPVNSIGWEFAVSPSLLVRFHNDQNFCHGICGPFYWPGGQQPTGSADSPVSAFRGDCINNFASYKQMLLTHQCMHSSVTISQTFIGQNTDTIGAMILALEVYYKSVFHSMYITHRSHIIPGVICYWVFDCVIAWWVNHDCSIPAIQYCLYSITKYGQTQSQKCCCSIGEAPQSTHLNAL